MVGAPACRSLPTPPRTLDDTMGGTSLLGECTSQPGASHRPRPVQGSAARGAQRSVESFRSLSQQDGHRGSQRIGTLNEEGEPRREAIRRLWVLPPSAPNGPRRRHATRKQSLNWLWLRTFDDGGAKGSLHTVRVGKQAMKPALHAATGTCGVQRREALLVDVQAVRRQEPRAELQEHHEEHRVRAADLVRAAVEVGGGRAAEPPTAAFNPGRLESSIGHHGHLPDAPVVPMPVRAGARPFKAEDPGGAPGVAADQPTTDSLRGTTGRIRWQRRHLSA